LKSNHINKVINDSLFYTVAELTNEWLQYSFGFK